MSTSLNASFRAVAATFARPAPKLTHSQQVCRLYRESLKQLQSWAIDRDVWLDEASAVRDQFDANAHFKVDSGRVKALLRMAREKLVKYQHPDRYVVNYMPGGTLYMRNPPLPLHVCYPNGIPEDVQHQLGGIEMNVDFSYADLSKKEAGGRFYVDPATKKIV